MSDILDRIDQALGCQQCGGDLGESPSRDFCSEDCQQTWHAARADTAPTTVDDHFADIPQRWIAGEETDDCVCGNPEQVGMIHRAAACINVHILAAGGAQ